MTLRPYQSSLKNRIIEQWSAGNRNVLAVAPCGAGKTIIMADIFRDNHKVCIAIAHRQELVAQISMAIARAGLVHKLIAPESVIRFVIGQHIRKLGRSYYDPQAPLAVAGVDTLNRRVEKLKPFLNRVSIWQTDEAHHLLIGNKWGTAVAAMPQARGVGWTATPRRADKRGLGSHCGGVFDCLVEGPQPRELIDAGFLCDYKIIGAASDIDTARVDISSSTGDFNASQLREEAHKSHIVGDVVQTYLKFVPGKQGVTFAVDVALATETAEAFRQAGVPAAVLHAKTPDDERTSIVDRFAARELRQIVNVDVLGEGYDCPGIEVCSLARPTSSLALAIQQMMRCMRPMEGKPWAYIIDHVGNVTRHGLPDAPRLWSLDGKPPRETDSDELPLNVCPNPDCFRVFEGWDRRCPHCHFKPETQTRERPEQVEGDLIEFSPELLARLRAQADEIMSESRSLPMHAGPIAVASAKKHHRNDRTAQTGLREAIAWWAGVRRDVYGDEDSISYRRFYHKFGIDVATAQSLRSSQANELYNKIWQDINTNE